jgi:cytochrome c oxidase subunit 2
VEKRILITATIFVLALAGVIALSVRMSGVGLPNCLLDVRPFQEGKVIEQGPKRYEIHLVARMWKFEPSEITLPPGSVADIYLSTADVTHGMAIVGTNVNLMAVPGAVNYARVKLERAGDYTILCNEYCGIAHQKMAGVIHVSEKKPVLTSPPTPAAPAAQLGGEELLAKYQCNACHSTDGSEGVAASFKALAGSKRTFADGSSAVADATYLRESIEKPDAKIVKGFEPMMPPIEIPPGDLEAIIHYIESLH